MRFSLIRRHFLAGLHTPRIFGWIMPRHVYLLSKSFNRLFEQMILKCGRTTSFTSGNQTLSELDFIRIFSLKHLQYLHAKTFENGPFGLMTFSQASLWDIVITNILN